MEALLRRWFAAGLLLALAAPALALEYRSAARAAILYDAPSTTAGRVAIAGAGLPLEVVVDTGAWVRVRDHGGRLAWIEQAALGGPRSVMIQSDTAHIRQQPRAEAGLAFRAVRGVLLEVRGGDAAPPGWLGVRHASGLAGWVVINEVWGQ
ncbi:MAG: SH3 domain-containing protein [Pseudomonadota bacterium]